MANTKGKRGGPTRKTTSSKTTKKKTSSSKRPAAQNARGSSVRSLEEIKQRNQVKAVLLFAAAILTACLVLIKGENVWAWFHNLLMGLFGGWAIMWPLLMIYVAVVIALERPHGTVSGKIWMTAAVIVLICTTVFVYSDIEIPENLGFLGYVTYLFQNGVENGGSGLIGGLLGTPLIAGAGEIGARILIVILLFVSIMLLTGTTLIQLYKTITKPVTVVSSGIHHAKMRRDEERRLLEENSSIDISLSGALPVHPVVSAPSSQNTAKGDRKKEQKSNPKLDKLNRIFGISNESEPYADMNPVVPDSSEDKVNLFSSDSVSSDESTSTFPSLPSVPEEKMEPVKEQEDSSEPSSHDKIDMAHTSQDSPAVSSSSVAIPPDSSEDALENAAKAAEEYMKKKAEAEKKEIASTAQMALYEENKDKENSYIFPPVTMLATGKKVNAALETEELQTNGQKLVDTLKSFGVQTSILDICRGPSVTRYELQPAPGVKISKITNLADDLALNLAATGVRIEAPIPGKAAVGIEIPNKNKTVVRMRELVESNAFVTSKGKLTVALGRDIAGQVIVADLAKMPHLLIAGTTGAGKSVCINSIIISLIYKSTPDEVRFLMIDPKVVELGVYNGIPHLLVPVVTDPRKAAGALNWAVTEMLNRYKIFADFNVKDLQGYNHMAAVNNYVDENGQPMMKMPQIVIIIDELADLMMAAPNEVEDSICRLAQMARAAGMHLLVATQRPTVDVVTGLIKANIPSRIAFAVSSAIDSRTILDSTGAEKLLGQGDMLFSPVGTPKPKRIQGCFVSESEIESIVDFIKKSRAIGYDEKIIEDIEKNAVQEKSKGDGKEEEAGTTDPVMEDAIKCVIEAGQASTSLLQRRLRLGYARAGRLIDEMEQMGIVGPHEGSKPRQVLMTYSQWLERNITKPEEPKEDEAET